MRTSNTNPQLKQVYHEFRKDTSPSLPELVYIEPTNLCPMKCYMCPRNLMDRPLGVMDYKLYCKIIDDLRNYIDTNMLNNNTRIVLVGQGESYLHRDLFQMIEYANEQGFTVWLDTTGLPLTQKFAEKTLNSPLRILQISCYAITPEKYHNIHGRDVFHRVFPNIIRTLHMLQRYKLLLRTTPKIVALPMRSARTLEEFPFIKWLYEQLPFDQVRVTQCRNYRGIFQKLGLTEELQFTRRKRLLKKYFKGVTWGKTVGDCLWDRLLIFWNGDVSPCPLDQNAEYVVGNIKDNNIAYLWNNDKYRAFRRLSLKQMSPNFCDNCHPSKIIVYPLLSSIWNRYKRHKFMKRFENHSRNVTPNFLNEHFPIDQEEDWLNNLEKLRTTWTSRKNERS